MRAPDFWHRRAGWQAVLLAPLAALASAVSARRVAKAATFHADVPTICVGNINLGGTGKTPTVIALIEALGANGMAAHVVSRGYGGTLEGPVRVQAARHSAGQVGDEPLLISAFAPVWVAKNRADGARAAQEAGADVIVMDDGFQNPSVAKDLSFVVVDAHVGFGNGRVVPAGPLREAPHMGLARAQGVVLVGDHAAQDAFIQAWAKPLGDLPVLRAHLAPVDTGRDWSQVRAVAFAGIGRPEKFFATLESLGATIVSRHALDDHQAIPPALFERLRAEARDLGAQLVTTEKDLMRLPTAAQREVLPVMVRLEFADPERLGDFLSPQALRR
ncbi:MAG: tetraacyldisaccharide 4'-kinase [Pseudomonadota bacterium]